MMIIITRDFTFFSFFMEFNVLRQMPCFYDVFMVSMVVWITSKSVSSGLQHGKIKGRNNI